LLDTEINNLISQYLQQLQMSITDEAEYKRILEGIPQDEMIKRYRPQAVKRVSGNLVLQKLAEEEKIEVKDAEIDAEIEQIIQDTGGSKDEQKKYYNLPENRNYIKNLINMRKAFDRLVDIAQGPKKKNTKQKEAK